MNNARKGLLAVYSVALVLIGVLFVPFNLVWGPEKTIHDLTYAPIWSLVNTSIEINGYHPHYELIVSRLGIELLILSLLAVVGYLVLGNTKR